MRKSLTSSACNQPLEQQETNVDIENNNEIEEAETGNRKTATTTKKLVKMKRRTRAISTSATATTSMINYIKMHIKKGRNACTKNTKKKGIEK